MNPAGFIKPEGKNPLLYKYMAAAGIECIGAVGLYLYSLGVDDFQTGLTKSGTLASCELFGRAETLLWFMPLCALVRLIFTPFMWNCLIERRAFNYPLDIVAVVAFAAAFFVPFVWFAFGIVFTPGVSDQNDFEAAIANWPADCRVERPYHGLFQTRAWAMGGGFLGMLGMHIWVIVGGPNARCRVGAIVVPTVLFSIFMLLGGPYFFLRSAPDSFCPDLWIPNTYYAVTIITVIAMVLLCLLPACLPDAVTFGVNRGHSLAWAGPYAQWSTWAWLIIAVVQILLLRWAITSGVQLVGGPPFEVCGADYKEFYYPRFWGLIYYTYGQFIAFNLWICGCSVVF